MANEFKPSKNQALKVFEKLQSHLQSDAGSTLSSNKVFGALSSEVSARCNSPKIDHYGKPKTAVIDVGIKGNESYEPKLPLNEKFVDLVLSLRKCKPSTVFKKKSQIKKKCKSRHNLIKHDKISFPSLKAEKKRK